MTTTQQNIGRLTSDTSQRLSTVFGETGDAASLRRQAWDVYDQLPFPTHEDEAWRRTDISVVDFSRMGLETEPVHAVDVCPTVFDEISSAEGHLLFQDNVSFRRVPPEVESRGILFTDLSVALKKHKDLVERYIFKSVSPRRGKFEEMNGAFWNRGVFVYVPKNTDVGLPLHGGFGFSSAGGAAYLPHTVIVLDEGARLTYFDEYVSVSPLGEKEPALSCAAVEIFLGPNAELQYVNTQRLDNNVAHFLTQHAVLQRNSRLVTVSVALGGKLGRVNLGSELMGEGAESRLCGLVSGAGSQRFTHHTFQSHQVPNTTSDVSFKSALKDQARSVYTGMIRISKDAQKSCAYQLNKNLLLSGSARADTIPMLEILANDVKCGHGASVGSLDDDQRFYLMARGLSKREAEHIIVEGFLEDVLSRVPGDPARDKMRLALTRKLQLEEEAGP